jgi:hypothetical protein
MNEKKKCLRKMNAYNVLREQRWWMVKYKEKKELITYDVFIIIDVKDFFLFISFLRIVSNYDNKKDYYIRCYINELKRGGEKMTK